MNTLKRYNLRSGRLLLIIAAVVAVLAGCSSSPPAEMTQGEWTNSTYERRMSEMERKMDMNSTRLNRLSNGMQDSIANWKALYREPGMSEQLFGAGYYDTLFLSEIHFDINKYDLRESYMQILDSAAMAMAESPASILIIKGHTDRSGGDFFNQQLSDQRAKAAKRYLVKRYDIPIHRIHSVGMGSDMEAYLNDTGSGINRNRRVEILLILLSDGGQSVP